MIELHLIGYTSDLRYLVLDVDEEGGRARYRVPVDGDLLLTLDEMRGRRREAGFDDPAAPRDGSPVPRDRPENVGAEDDGHEGDDADLGRLFGGTSGRSEPPEASADDPGDGPDDEDLPVDAEPARSAPHEDSSAGAAPAADPAVTPAPADALGPDGEGGGIPEEGDAPSLAEVQDEEVDPDASSDDDARVESLLSPAEIQTLLRRGVSPRRVAERAGTEIAWIERWLPPILAERRQVLEEAHAICLERARLGVSKQPLTQAVRTNLRAKRVDLDDVEWTTKRRADGSWTVSVRYRSRGRRRTASWRLDREKGRLSPASELARELGFARSRRRGR